MLRIKLRYVFIIGLLIGFFQCNPKTLTQIGLEKKYLFKTEFDTAKYSYGFHIEIKQRFFPSDDPYDYAGNRVVTDDRNIINRSRYSRDVVIEILGEYLTFQGDKTLSNKTYQFRSTSHLERPEVKEFTIEIEALYSFTRILTQGLPPIRPVLINKFTRDSVNSSPQALEEVYEIYRTWYKNNKKSNFKEMTLPLAGSSFYWLGEDVGMEGFVKKSL